MSENKRFDAGQTRLEETKGAVRARKRPVTLQVRFAREPGVCKTQEGPVRYEAGDAILTGIHGETWPVPKEKFGQLYEPAAGTVAGEDGMYRKRPDEVWALQVREPFEVVLSGDRGTLQGKPGDWLVQYAPGDCAVVADDVFRKTCEVIAGDG